MGDPLCGPSNPLQTFQKQTSADRTLQQDRVTSRSNPQESFRSPPGPNAGILDPEFEAFQAGLPPPPQEQFPFHPQIQQTFTRPSKLPEWAADFQRLHVSSPPPQLRNQVLPQYDFQAPSKAAGSSSWHQEFMRQHSPTQQPTATNNGQFSYPSAPHFQPHIDGMAGFSPLGNHAVAQGHSHSREKDIYDDAAFTQAFDALGNDIADQPVQQEQSDHLAAQAEAERLKDAEETRNAAAELHGRFEAQRVMEEAGIPMTANGLPTFEENVTPALQQDERQQPQSEAEQTRQIHDDSDDLAATAGQLLESVADNKTAKFENSKFLELMRKLRDKEVRVEGDKMVDVSETTSSTPRHPEHVAFDPSAIRQEIFDGTLPDTNAHETPISFIPADEQDTDFGRENGGRREDAELRYNSYDMDDGLSFLGTTNPLHMSMID